MAKYPLLEQFMANQAQTGNTWDWENGESAPYGIRTPWLGYAWHYDDNKRIVPNNPNNSLTPWNKQGSNITMEQFYQSPFGTSLGGGVSPTTTQPTTSQLEGITTTLPTMNQSIMPLSPNIGQPTSNTGQKIVGSWMKQPTLPQGYNKNPELEAWKKSIIKY